MTASGPATKPKYPKPAMAMTTASVIACIRQRPATTTAATSANARATRPPRDRLRKMPAAQRSDASSALMRRIGARLSEAARPAARMVPPTRIAASSLGSPIVPLTRVTS